MNAVIVEDSKVIRRMIGQLLKQLDIEVVGEAADGLAGMEMILEKQPDLVTVDVNMPKCSGEEVIRLVKKAKLKTKICVISSVDEAEEQLLMELGADGVIEKPITLQKLVRFSYESGLKML